MPTSILLSVPLSLSLATGVMAQAQPPKPTPPKPAPSQPAPARPAAAKPPRPTSAAPAPPLAPSPLHVCDYITADEAKGLLGMDVLPSSAPSRGGFTSCGYTSPNGDAVTLSIADYNLSMVAQQFFDQTRKALKLTTIDDTLGVPAFTYTIFAGPVATPPTPAGARRAPAGAAAPPPPVDTPPGFALVAMKDQRIVTLEAVGLTAGRADHLPKLRAIVTRVLATFPAAPAAETPPR